MKNLPFHVVRYRSPRTAALLQTHRTLYKVGRVSGQKVKSCNKAFAMNGFFVKISTLHLHDS